MDHSNPLNRLNSLGQSIWLDFIDRSILSDGTLARLIRDDDLAGLTSNPAIFEKAISQDPAYTDDIARPGRAGMQPEALYTSVVLEDISRAAAAVAQTAATTRRNTGQRNRQLGR